MPKEKLMTKQESKKYETISRLLAGEITQKQQVQYYTYQHAKLEIYNNK